MNPIEKDFASAIERLEEVLALEKTAINRDSAIKRFELCFDLAWKSVKNFAKGEGVECNSPRACFKTAFQLKLIDYGEKWIEMIEDRNKSVHLYREEFADEIYKHLSGYAHLFEELAGALKKK